MARPGLGSKNVLDALDVPGSSGADMFGDHLCDGVHDAEKGQPSVQKRGNALLVGRVEDRGAVPPRAPTSRASATAGNASSSSGKNCHVWALVQSHAKAAASTRSGQASPRAIGSRMSGGLACASVEPSVNSTIECTID